MAGTQKTKRITYKHTRPNPLFQSWLEELYDEAKEKGSKLEAMLKEALESMSKYPLPLSTGAECAILKGFDKKLCLFMDKRLQVYTENSQNSIPSLNSSVEVQEVASDVDNNLPGPPTSSGQKITKATESTSAGNSTKPVKAPKEPKEKKGYAPSHRSGGYAILITLLNNMKESTSKPSLTKEQLIEKAQEHSEESFTRPKPFTHYTAWSNMARLITKGLVEKIRKKKAEYSLTDEGVALATKLLSDSQNIPTVNDIIFSDSSFGNVSQSNDIATAGNAESDNAIAVKSKAPIAGKKRLSTTAETAVPKVAKADVPTSKVLSQDVEIDTNVIEMGCGEFDVFLLIDKMESSGLSRKNDPTVAQFKKYPDLKHEFRNLKVGDFTWVARRKSNPDQEFVLPFIVERKRMDDLGSSIKDGRFHEQKFRLRKCGLENVIYLVEQYGKNQHVGLPLPSLMQALANTRVQDGFRVQVTDSLTNSARFLAMMTMRLTLEYKNKTLKGRNGEAKPGELMTFTHFNKASAKTKALSVTETFIKILLQLKGMSVEKALAITTAYKTPRSLIVKYQKISNKEGEILLANLKYGGLSRQVGLVVSKAIYQLFTIKNLQ